MRRLVRPLASLAALMVAGCVVASLDPPDDLLEARVPRAGAGDPGWNYQQRATADFDGDGTAETAVLISDVLLDPAGRPLWEDGHRWQVYIEEQDGARTYLYAKFLPNGALTAEATEPGPDGRPTIVLLERAPRSLRMFEFAYDGSGRSTVVSQARHDIGDATFQGSPRP